MSVPFFAYLGFFFQNPRIALYDFRFIYRRFEFYIVLLGLGLYIYSLIYQITHRKQLIRKGPYRFVRHPQYVAIIIMTFGMTLIAFQTSPIFNFNIGNLNGYTVLLYIWIGEVIAYIILGKIEELALKARYTDEFIEYSSKVSFMIPFLKLKRNKIERV
jgi:protein-S-isoprenylcysteine O-methyltransferase Ste14